MTESSKPEMCLYAHTEDYNFKETDVLSVKWGTHTDTSTDFAVIALQCSTLKCGIMTFFKTNRQMANTLFHYAITEKLPRKLLNFLCLKSHLRANQPPANRAAVWKEKRMCRTNKANVSCYSGFQPGISNKTKRQTQLHCFQHTERRWILNGIA